MFMKRRNIKNYLIIFIIFVVIMSVSLLFFMNRFNNIEISNQAGTLLKDLYTFDSGKYTLKNGINS